MRYGLRNLFWAVLILGAGVVAALSIRYGEWIWLRAIAAGIAASGLLIAAYFTKEQARHAREQVHTAQTALIRAQDEAYRRSAEAREAAGVAQESYEISAKSRLDSIAPRASVVLSYKIMLHRPGAAGLMFVDIPDTFSVDERVFEGDTLSVYLTFTLTNHGDLPLPVLIPEPSLHWVGSKPNYQSVLMPHQELPMRVVAKAPLKEWVDAAAQREDHLGMHPIHQWLDQKFEVQVFDPSHSVMDNHIWTGGISPIMIVGAGRVGKAPLPIHGLPVARVERTYFHLDKAAPEFHPPEAAS